jgi:hypothetical protein
MKPACMTDDEFALWAAGNEKLLLMFKASSPCRDCTPLFHADMLDGGMCDGVPGTGDAEPERCGPKPKLREHTYAELKAMRAAYPKFGAPPELSAELARARWRERDRDRRRRVAV